ncbi:ATP-binding protein [Candidatus Pacearchaeota archaeon]|nr:ATP-binding protein [Candidatus Pacearchaeota archaeon]
MVKVFYDRCNELKFLKEKYDNLTTGEFGVLYGRRRMGKSELLRKFLKKIKTKKIYINVIDSNKKDFMNSLSKKIEETFGDVFKITNWGEFFEYLSEKSGDEKIVFVIDEFQRINSFSKDFIFALQEYWGTHLRKQKIMIIICGSSMSMMHKLALEEKGPLYGRKTFEYALKQFKYLDFREMFKNFDEEDKIKIFSVFGGTPKYLDDFKSSNLGIIEGFEKLVLSDKGPLFEDPINALKFELKNPERYISILRAISTGKVETKEIADSLGLDNREISPYLRNLSELLDIIESNNPLFGKKRMMRYKIKDNFFKFWYRFVYPFRENIEMGITKPVINRINKEIETFCGRIFEDIVREFFIFMNGKTLLNKKIEFLECGKWWEGNEDIDLVLKNKNKTVFIEVKYREKKVNSKHFEDLKEKSNKTSAGGRFEYIIVSKSGFEKELIDKKIPNLLLIDLNKLSEIMDEETKKETEIQEDLIKWFEIH